MTSSEFHHLQLEVDRLTTVLDAAERHLDHIIDIVRAAERLYEVLTGPVVIINDTIETATRNLGDALKAAHR